MTEICAFLTDMLIQWQASEITPRDVFEQAEEIWEHREWPHSEKFEDDSIVVEVLMQLESLPSTWIISEDIPAFLEFLSTPTGKAIDGWRRWTQYWDNMDFKARAKTLASDPLYSPVCLK